MEPLKPIHRLTFEFRTETQGAGGNLVETWAPLPGFVRIQGEVLPGRGDEFFSARQINATETGQIKVRYQPELQQGMRAVHHVRPGIDDYWYIEGRQDIQARGRELWLYVVKRYAEGYRRGADLENPPA